MININKQDCSGCSACANACPKGCITMEPDQEGFVQPVIDAQRCIECGVCEKVCPINFLRNVGNADAQESTYYAAYNRNEQIRLDSSSGGIFTLLAEYVLERNGVVFGAALTEQNKVRHICLEKNADLSRLRGSKYVQSEIGKAYTLAKEFLDSGRVVLFSGTPCQIGGLKAYLRKEYTNLITQDVVCHGCPSPLVWRKYLEYQEKKFGKLIQSVSFRNKKNGWKRYNLQLIFADGKRYARDLLSDLFMCSFLRDYCLRPSCYQCGFRGAVRHSDLTLADYWGVENVHPELDDDKGTSLVIANTDAGHKLLEAILPSCVFCITDRDEALRYNPAMICSPSRPEERDSFIGDVETYGFKIVKHKYFPTTYKSIIRYIRNRLSSVKHVLTKIARGIPF